MKSAKEIAQHSSAPPTRHIQFALVVVFGLTLAIYLLRLDRAFGLFVDDGWYVLLAKALASGQGYTLTNSPSPGILPLYPPAFAFVLSLIYRLAPAFPQNIYWLKLLSLAAMLGTGALVYWYFTRLRHISWPVALGIAWATMISPMLVLLATSTLMSECFFLFLFVATVLLVERARQTATAGERRQFLLLAGTVAGIAGLTRSIGVALILAGVIYLLKERLVKDAISYGAVALLLMLPWTLFTTFNKDPRAAEHNREQGGHIVLPYHEQFWQRRAGFTFAGTVTAKDLPARVVNNMRDIAGRDVLRIVAAPLFEWLRDPFAEAQQENVRAGGSGSPLLISFLLSLLVMAGYVIAAHQRLRMAELAVLFSLGITVLWPWETIRFVLPLIPFLVFYFLTGLGALARWLAPREGWREPWGERVALAALALILALNLGGHGYYINKVYAHTSFERPQWLQIFDEVETMMRWLAREAPADVVIATVNPPLVNLFTAHKTISADDPAGNWENWKRLNVRYLVRASVYPEPPDPAESRFRVAYRSQLLPSFRVLDLGPPNERPAWVIPAMEPSTATTPSSAATQTK